MQAVFNRVFSYLIFDILLSVIVIVVVLYFCVIVCVVGCESVPVIVLYCIYLASKLILLASKTIHNDNYQIIQILCDAKWRG